MRSLYAQKPGNVVTRKERQDEAWWLSRHDGAESAAFRGRTFRQAFDHNAITRCFSSETFAMLYGRFSHTFFKWRDEDTIPCNIPPLIITRN